MKWDFESHSCGSGGFLPGPDAVWWWLLARCCVRVASCPMLCCCGFLPDSALLLLFAQCCDAVASLPDAVLQWQLADAVRRWLLAQRCATGLYIYIFPGVFHFCRQMYCIWMARAVGCWRFGNVEQDDADSVRANVDKCSELAWISEEVLLQRLASEYISRRECKMIGISWAWGTSKIYFLLLTWQVACPLCGPKGKLPYPQVAQVYNT